MERLPSSRSHHGGPPLGLCQFQAKSPQSFPSSSLVHLRTPLGPSCLGWRGKRLHGLGWGRSSVGAQASPSEFGSPGTYSPLGSSPRGWFNSCPPCVIACIWATKASSKCPPYHLKCLAHCSGVI